MAEGFLRTYGGVEYDVHSAGTKSSTVNRRGDARGQSQRALPKFSRSLPSRALAF
jgi:protein-tyrosine-phosphatase